MLVNNHKLKPVGYVLSCYIPSYTAFNLYAYFYLHLYKQYK